MTLSRGGRLHVLVANQERSGSATSLTRFAPDGAEEWRTQIDTRSYEPASYVTFAIDEDAGVVVASRWTSHHADASPSEGVFLVRLSSSGHVTWRVNGQASPSSIEELTISPEGIVDLRISIGDAVERSLTDDPWGPSKQVGFVELGTCSRKSVSRLSMRFDAAGRIVECR
jgi:hypothetical protein